MHAAGPAERSRRSQLAARAMDRLHKSAGGVLLALRT